VTLNGQPLANALVTFQPMAKGGNVAPGLGSTGTTNANGEYQLRVVGNGPRGAEVGPHRVTISALEGPPIDPTKDVTPPQRERVPRRYNADSTLTCEVPPKGNTQADFTLTVP
jgi:hypothetical protein